MNKILEDEKLKGTVNDCTSCGGSHDEVQLHLFKTDQTPWTHWYKCPKTEDPAKVRLVQTKNGQVIEVTADICSKLEEAINQGEFMVCIFRANADGSVQLDRFTRQFPYASFKAVSSELQNSMQTELNQAGIQPQMPMPQPVQPQMTMPQPAQPQANIQQPQAQAPQQAPVQGELQQPTKAPRPIDILPQAKQS